MRIKLKYNFNTSKLMESTHQKRRRHTHTKASKGTETAVENEVEKKETKNEVETKVGEIESNEAKNKEKTKVDGNEPKIEPKPEAPIQSARSKTPDPEQSETQFSQMKYNVKEQVSRITEIVNHAGKFVKFYPELTNIVESLNTMLESYVTSSRKAILYDLYDQVIKETNFKKLQEQLKIDVNQKDSNISFQAVDLDRECYDIDSINLDEFVNMYNYASTETVKDFKRYQKLVNSDIDNMMQSFDKFEQDLCEFRVRKYPEVQKYVDVLYKLHVKYVRNLRANKKVPEFVTLGGIEVQMKKGQSDFIRSGLKTLLRIE